MKIDTPESRKRARALLLLGLDALDAFDREQKWAESPGKFSQSVAERRKEDARARGVELATRFNALNREYEAPAIECNYD